MLLVHIYKCRCNVYRYNYCHTSSLFLPSILTGKIAGLSAGQHVAITQSHLGVQCQVASLVGHDLTRFDPQFMNPKNFAMWFQILGALVIFIVFVALCYVLFHALYANTCIHCPLYLSVSCTLTGTVRGLCTLEFMFIVVS